MSGTSPHPPLKDEAVRRAAVTDFDRNWVLTAGAGTGKTTILIERILHALEQPDARVDRVAAITFTEAAAAELRQRLRLEIEKRLARGGGEIWERALHDLDRAALTTIHAFAARLLRERPLEAGVDPGFQVAEPLAAQVLLENAWRRFLAHELHHGDEDWLQVLRYGGLDDLRALAGCLARERDALADDPNHGSRERTLDCLWRRLREIEAEWAEICRHCDSDGDAVRKRWIRTRELLEEAEGDPEALAARLAGMDPGHLPDATRGGGDKTWAGHLEARDRGRELSREAEKIFATLQGLPEAVATHGATLLALEKLEGFLVLYEEEKRVAGVLDFQDLLLRARDLVRDHLPARRALGGGFDQILVDEFQDTDPLQAELILYLCDRGEARRPHDVDLVPGRLFLVGDPKQSIYGWRRADMGVYEEVRRLVVDQGGREGNPESNFRSTEAVVSLVNDFFGDQMREREEGRLQPRYAPIEAARREPDPDGPLLHVLGVTPQALGYEKLLADEARRAEARALAWRLAAVADGDPGAAELFPVAGEDGVRAAGPGDIGILARTHAIQRAYEAALQEAGVPYVVLGGRGYFRRPEVADLLNLLRALVHPTDRLSLVGALRSPLFALPDSDLLALAREDRLDYRRDPPNLEDPEAKARVEGAWSSLRRWHEASRRLSAAPLLDRILEESPLALAAAAEPDGLQRIANLEKLSSLATRTAPFGDPTVAGWLEVLETLGEDLPEEGDSPLSEATADAVRLLTIHGAKGLEFPVVVVGGLQTDPGRGTRNEDLVLRRPPGGGSPDLGISVGPWTNLAWAAELKAWEEERRGEEALRLLYVALTRARDHLVLCGSFTAGGAGGWLEDLLAHLDLSQEPFRTEGTDLTGTVEEAGGLAVRLHRAAPGHPSRRRRRPAEVHASPLPTDDPLEASRSAARDRRAEAPGRPSDTSVSALDRARREAAPVEGPPRGPGPAGGAPGRATAATLLGEAVHDLLDTVRPGGEEGWRRRLEAWFAARPEGTRLPLEEIQRRATELLEGLFASDLWRGLTGARRLVTECDLALEEQDRLVRGRADLLVERVDGSLEIWDWKTDALAATGRRPEEAAGEHAEQARVYRRAVERATGRPVARFLFVYLEGCRAVAWPPEGRAGDPEAQEEGRSSS